MTTQRAVVFLLITGGLVMFAVQNSSPWLPLAFFGVLIQPLPLSFWLVGAIAAGAITTLFMVGLLNLYGPDFHPRSPKRRRSSVKPSSSQERTPFQTDSSGRRPSDSPSRSESSAATNRADIDNADGQDWDTFKSPEQWDDWGQSPNPSVAVNTPGRDSSAQGKSKQKAKRQKEHYAVEESFEEIAAGWDEYEESADKEPTYVPRGGSPVDDDLDEISAGWDDYEDEYEEPEDQPTPFPQKDYEVKQAPKTVYRSGSLYSYSYDKTEAADAGRGEDTDDEIDEIDQIDGEDYPTDTDKSADRRQTAPGPGRVGPDGVYEADYRVIVPPIRNLDEEDDWEGREGK